MLVVARLPLGDKKTGFERVSIWEERIIALIATAFAGRGDENEGDSECLCAFSNVVADVRIDGLVALE